jgi:hypothetical protein
MDKVRAEIMNNSHHLYVHFHFIYGQKPINPEVP